MLVLPLSRAARASYPPSSETPSNFACVYGTWNAGSSGFAPHAVTIEPINRPQNRPRHRLLHSTLAAAAVAVAAVVVVVAAAAALLLLVAAFVSLHIALHTVAAYAPPHLPRRCAFRRRRHQLHFS